MVYSQNFIKSPKLVKQLFSVSSLELTDLIVEIGPGKGIITQELINCVAKVISVEKDHQLFYFLKDKFSDVSNLQIINQDFLTYNLPKDPYKIFSNIPFSITSDIFTKILTSRQKPTEMYFIMQEEAASKYYPSNTFNNQDSILLSPFYDIQILGDIDRTAFTPKPQVDIVFVKFTQKNKPLLDIKNYQQFRDFVIYGFNQWKPNIFEIYKKIFSYDQFKKINHQLKINNLKPTQLSFDHWLKLFNVYIEYVSQAKQRLVLGFEIKYLTNIKVKKY